MTDQPKPQPWPDPEWMLVHKANGRPREVRHINGEVLLCLTPAEQAAQVAAAAQAMREAAKEVITAYDEYDQQLCCDGRECGCRGASVHDAIRHGLDALPIPHHDALAAAIAAAVASEREKAAVGVELHPADDSHDQALDWIVRNLMAIRRDNGSMEYTLGQVIAAFEAGRARGEGGGDAG